MAENEKPASPDGLDEIGPSEDEVREAAQELRRRVDSPGSYDPGELREIVRAVFRAASRVRSDATLLADAHDRERTVTGRRPEPRAPGGWDVAWLRDYREAHKGASLREAQAAHRAALASRPKNGDRGAVYARPECLFKYCPDPDGCRSVDECASPKITDEQVVKMAHEAVHHHPRENVLRVNEAGLDAAYARLIQNDDGAGWDRNDLRDAINCALARSSPRPETVASGDRASVLEEAARSVDTRREALKTKDDWAKGYRCACADIAEMLRDPTMPASTPPAPVGQALAPVDEERRKAIRRRIGEEAWAVVAPEFDALDADVQRNLDWANHLALPAMDAAAKRLGEAEIDRSGEPWRFVSWPAPAGQDEGLKTTEAVRSKARQSIIHHSYVDLERSGERNARELVKDLATDIATLQARLATAERKRDEARKYLKAFCHATIEPEEHGRDVGVHEANPTMRWAFEIAEEGLHYDRYITGGQVRRAMEIVGYDKLKIEPASRTISDELADWQRMYRDLRPAVEAATARAETAEAALAEAQRQIAEKDAALEQIVKKNQEREWTGADKSDGYGDQGWITRDGQFAKIARAALNPAKEG